MLLDYVRFLYVLAYSHVLWIAIVQFNCARRWAGGRKKDEGQSAADTGAQKTEKSANDPRSNPRLSAEKVKNAPGANPQNPAYSNENYFTTPDGKPAIPMPNMKFPEQNKVMNNNNFNNQRPAGSKDDDYFDAKGGGGFGGVPNAANNANNQNWQFGMNKNDDFGKAPNAWPRPENNQMGAFDQNRQDGGRMSSDDIFKPKNEGFGRAPNAWPRPENNAMGAFGQNRQDGNRMSSEDEYKQRDAGFGGPPQNRPWGMENNKGPGRPDMRPPAGDMRMGSNDFKQQHLPGSRERDPFKPTAPSGEMVNMRPPMQNKMPSFGFNRQKPMDPFNGEDYLKQKDMQMNKNEIKEERNAQFCTY